MENAGARARKSLFVRCRTVEFGAGMYYFWHSNIAVLKKGATMEYRSILKSKVTLSLLGAAFLSMSGLVQAQINTPGQGDAMQRPSDSMQPPVIPGKPFQKGTTRGEEAESKNRFDKNEEEAMRHKLDTNQGNASKRDGGSSSGSGGY